MRVNQHSSSAPVIRRQPETLEQLLASEMAIDVSACASRHGLGRMAIEVRTYERFVEWNALAMRRLGIHLETQVRLDALIEASAYACCDPRGGCFVCKAVDAKGYDARPSREVFELRNLGTEKHPSWVINS
jgi:hypothetical protein